MKRYTFILPLLLLLVGAGCEDDPVIDEALLDVTWKPDSLWSPTEFIAIGNDSIRYDTFVSGSVATSTKYVPFGGLHDISVLFNREGVMGASICNDGSASYQIHGTGSISTINGSWTEAACPTWHPVEQLIRNVLAKSTVYSVLDGQLTLGAADASYSAVFTATYE